jgi:hypothetical protein
MCTKPGVDPSWWFSEADDSWTWRIAHWYCKRCPVINECALDAIKTGDIRHGIRAGLQARDRAKLARAFKAAKSLRDFLASEAA